MTETDAKFASDLAAAILAALEVMANPPLEVGDGQRLATEIDFKWRGHSYHLDIALGPREPVA